MVKSKAATTGIRTGYQVVNAVGSRRRSLRALGAVMRPVQRSIEHSPPKFAPGRVQNLSVEWLLRQDIHPNSGFCQLVRSNSNNGRIGNSASTVNGSASPGRA